MPTIRYNGGTIAIGLRSSQQYILIQGLKIDRVGSAAVSSSLIFVNVNKNAAGQCGPVRVQYCYENNQNTSPKSGRSLIDNTGTTASTTLIEYRYNAVVGWGTNAGVALSTSTLRQALVHNNVFVSDAAVSPQWINFGSNDAGVAVDHRAYNNTFVMVLGDAASCIASTAAAGANAAAQKHFYNNLFVSFRASTDSFITGNAVWEGVAWTGGTKDIGNNVFIRTAGGSWSAGQPYQVPWNPDNTDTGEPAGETWSTDTTGTTNPFNASGTPFDWNANSAGWLLRLPGDYRLTGASGIRAAGQGGAVPGALIEGVTPPVSVDDEYTINYDTTLTQSAPGVLANDTDADGDPLVAFLVTGISPAVAGTLTFSNDGSFIFAPTSGYIGDATFTYKAFDGFFYSTPSTVTIHIHRPPSTVLGSASLIGASTPGKIVPDATIRLLMNSLKRFERDYRPSDPVSVTAAHAANASVAASTTDAVLSLGSVATATALHLVTDQDVTVKINNSPTMLVKAGGCLQIVGCSITSLKVTNAATNRSANVTYLVVS